MNQRRCNCVTCATGIWTCGRCLTPYTDDDDDDCSGDPSCKYCITIDGYCRSMYNKDAINV